MFKYVGRYIIYHWGFVWIQENWCLEHCRTHNTRWTWETFWNV